MTKKDAKEKIQEADARAQYWLYIANIRIENNKSPKSVEEAERKARYWLDRLNKLEGLWD